MKIIIPADFTLEEAIDLSRIYAEENKIGTHTLELIKEINSEVNCDYFVASIKPTKPREAFKPVNPINPIKTI